MLNFNAWITEVFHKFFKRIYENEKGEKLNTKCKKRKFLKVMHKLN